MKMCCISESVIGSSGVLDYVIDNPITFVLIDSESVSVGIMG
jgi:hypothetical protein